MVRRVRILPNHNESHTLKSSSNPCCTVWHQRLVYTAIRYHLGVKTKRPNWTCLAQSSEESEEVSHHASLSESLVDYRLDLAYFAVAHRLAKALCSATGLYSLQPMVLISINPCHLSQPLHLTFQHPHVLSMFFSNNPSYLILGRGESTKVLFSRKHKLASVKDTTIVSQDKPSTYEPCSLLQSHLNMLKPSRQNQRISGYNVATGIVRTLGEKDDLIWGLAQCHDVG